MKYIVIGTYDTKEEAKRVVEREYDNSKGLINYFEVPEDYFKPHKNEEFKFLKWYVQNTDFGPGSGDVEDWMRMRYMREFKKLPPKGWNFWSSGEEITEDDLEEYLKE